MANRDASVRLNLAAAGFLSQLRELERHSKSFGDAVEGIGDHAQSASRKSSGFFAAMKTGFGGAKNALGELGGQLRTVLSTAATLGGTLSVGAAIKEASDATSSYKDLAFAIRAGTGASVTWQQVQQDVESVSGRWKRSNKEVADSFAAIFAETGDLEFTKKAIDSVAMAATASGKNLTGVAGTLNEKFGIGADGIDDALAAVQELGNQGGVSVEELGEKLGFVGASAKLLGMQGQQGLQQILGMLNMADDAIGPPRQKFAALSSLLEGMADPGKMKEIQKALGVQLLDGKGGVKSDAMDRILAKTKGQQGELAKVFSGGELKLISSLGESFSKGFTSAEGDVKAKTAAGISAYRAALLEAGKVSLTGADQQREAIERLKDPQRQLQDAMNRFTKAFQQPEMIDAIDKVAKAAPQLAQTFASLISFATKHPLLSGAMVVGGVAAKGAAGALITKVSESAMKTAGETLASVASKHPGWAAAGGVMGVAAGAAIAFAVGKSLIDASMGDAEKRSTDAMAAGNQAEVMAKHGLGTPEERAQAAMDLRQQIETMEREGPGIANKLFGSAANLIDPNVERAETRHARELAERKAQLEMLEKAPPGKPKSLADVVAPTGPPGTPPGSVPGAGGPSTDAKRIASEVVNGDPKKVAISNEQAMAQAIARQISQTPLTVRVVGGGGGTNGLPGAPGNAPGSTPRS